ncbi:MAG: alpha/beta fold hydrolase [Pyramidobacter sp.]|nr:alpha/beta fold hydrolase [Pyramidobacter sp.]
MDNNGTNERFDLSWLFEDKPVEPGVSPADYDGFEVVVDNARIYGQALWPDGCFAAPRPTCVLLHGYPGTGRNDDLAQALRRCGCAVIVPHARGAWGSEGTYSFAHIVEDAIAVAREVRSGELGKKLNADADAVFLIGHSMGGWASLNAARSLPWLRGLVLLAPYDLSWHITGGTPQELRSLLTSGLIMNTGGEEALFAEAVRLKDRSFAAAFDAVKDMNVCGVYGTLDPVAPFAMSAALWALLDAHSTRAVQRRVEYPTAHGLDSHRIAMTRFVAGFIADSLKA